MKDKSPELSKLEELTLRYLLKLDEKQIDHIRDIDIVKAGETYIAHGHELGSGGGINVARNVMLRSFCNIIFGHFHRTQESPAKQLSRLQFASWSVGCLAGLNPAYMPVNQWNQGCGFLEIQDDGMFTMHNKKIIGGKIV